LYRFQKLDKKSKISSIKSYDSWIVINVFDFSRSREILENQWTAKLNWFWSSAKLNCCENFFPLGTRCNVAKVHKKLSAFENKVKW